jgi:hypothetical protein
MFPEGLIKNIFTLVACSRSRLSLKKKSDADLHEQSLSREILERKHTVQRISREWKKIKNAIANRVLIETDEKSLRWYKPMGTTGW